MLSFHKTMGRLIFSLVMTCVGSTSSALTDEIKPSFGVYAAHVSLMSYKGDQDDLTATLDFEVYNSRLHPFARVLVSRYSYLPPAMGSDYIHDERLSAGLGLDYKITDYLTARFIVEDIKNKLSDTRYIQESYGLIYNQYLDYSYFQISNYAESFYIPRVSNKTTDTFARFQILKSYQLSQTLIYSNVMYPFAQFKTKFNDNSLFGVTGQNMSAGLGYKFHSTTKDQDDSFSAVAEAHSIFYQSKELNGDWFQILAAVQLGIK